MKTEEKNNSLKFNMHSLKKFILSNPLEKQESLKFDTFIIFQRKPKIFLENYSLYNLNNPINSDWV
jgi:hypothetical protein